MRLVLKEKNLQEEKEGSTVEPVDVLKAYSYCSIILDSDSQNKLKQAVAKLKPETGWDDADSAKDKKLCHHITINMGTKAKFPDAFKNGQKVTFDVTGYSEFDGGAQGVAAVAVTPAIKTASGNPHITVFLKGGMSPGKAADLSDTGKIKPTKKQELSVTGLNGVVNIPSEVV